MIDLIEIVNRNGVLVPALVRPKEDGRYEMISGHCRKFASRQASFEEIPCVIRELTDDEAIQKESKVEVDQEEALHSGPLEAIGIKIL